MSFFRRKDIGFSSKPSSKHSSPVSSPTLAPHLKPRNCKTQPGTPDEDVGLPLDLLRPGGGARSKTSTPSITRNCSFNNDQLTGDLGSYCLLKDVPVPNTSRLSKTLYEILNDKDALGYFIQFMEHSNAGHYIRFWLEAESFQAATWTRIRSHSMNTMSQSSVTQQSPRRDDQRDNTRRDDDQRDGQRDNTLGHHPGDLANNDTNVDDSDTLKASVEKDAVEIYSRYISLDASKPIGISDQLRNDTIRKICCEDGRVDPLSFSDCQDFVVALMERDYFEQFTRSEFYCQHQVDFLTSGDAKLSDILYNENAMFYFMEFVEREGGSTMLQFVMNVDNFEKTLMKSPGNYDSLQAQEDAMVLYEKYFSLQATTPLGFDDEVRFEIESNICRESGPLPQCFQSARSIVLAYIDRNYFRQFLTSDIYFKYLSELIQTIHSSQDLVQKQRRRAGSDASSENSAPSTSNGDSRTKNTLLAMDGSKKIVNLRADDLRIDMGNIYNPQSLWQRGNSGNLSLGHIDSMGHFISNFDREPDHKKKSESFFSKKKKDKDKSQEEMALKVAQMIINDVTNLTAPEDDGEDGS